MKTALRAMVLLAVFAGVAWGTYRGVNARASSRYGSYGAEVRLAAEMAGLFAGGIAAAGVGIAMVWSRSTP